MPCKVHHNTQHTHSDTDSTTPHHLWVSQCTMVHIMHMKMHTISKHWYGDFSATLYMVKKKIICPELLQSFLTWLYIVQYNSFNVEADALEILILQQLRKTVRSSEDSASVTPNMPTHSMIISCYLDSTKLIKLLRWLPKISTWVNSASNKRNHITQKRTLIPLNW